MKRRTFTKIAGLSAVAATTTGFIKFNGHSYVGDCETTSDILGPFYRPNSPVRNNLVIEEEAGVLTELTGIVRHKDCSTPYKGAKIELWHCSAKEVYDNETSEFRYRGTTFCDENGKYHFTTQMPVPYDAGGGNYRPAHFHLLISAPGYQNLITQIYFVGDPYLESDESSGDKAAENRILDIEEIDGTNRITFDCNMNDKLMASYSALDKIVGTYSDVSKEKEVIFFQKDGLLWGKNEVFGRAYDYLGNNEFGYGGMPSGNYDKYYFELQGNDGVRLVRTSKWGEKEKTTLYNKIQP